MERIHPPGKLSSKGGKCEKTSQPWPEKNRSFVQRKSVAFANLSNRGGALRWPYFGGKVEGGKGEIMVSTGKRGASFLPTHERDFPQHWTKTKQWKGRGGWLQGNRYSAGPKGRKKNVSVTLGKALRKKESVFRRVYALTTVGGWGKNGYDRPYRAGQLVSGWKKRMKRGSC